MLNNTFFYKIFKKIYKVVKGREYRHNMYLWPYIKVTRNNDKIDKIEAFGQSINIIPIENIKLYSQDLHILLSGPSIKKIDYSKLKKCSFMGVNGSINIKNNHDINFDYYCIVDRTFAYKQKETIHKIIQQDLILFITPDVLRFILEHQNLSDFKCKISIIEDINERAYEPRLNQNTLSQYVESIKSISVYDLNKLLGFSFDSDLGWFDADTVAYSALHTGVWLGAKNIYFHGLDIKNAETSFRFYAEGANKPSTRLVRKFSEIIKPSFVNAVKDLSNKGINVFNLSDESAFSDEDIPFKKWQDLID